VIVVGSTMSLVARSMIGISPEAYFVVGCSVSLSRAAWK
jgi:hypothetical protein